MKYSCSSSIASFLNPFAIAAFTSDVVTAGALIVTFTVLGYFAPKAAALGSASVGPGVRGVIATAAAAANSSTAAVSVSYTHLTLPTKA